MDLNLGKFLIKEIDKFVILRENILKILEENIKNKKLVLISAPPGYGKTTFLASFIKEFKNYKFIYYNLNEEDRDFYKFIFYLIFSFRKIIKNFGNYLLELVKINTPCEIIIKNFINEIIRKIKQNIIIVLDDFHYIQENKSIHYFLNNFLNYTPFNIKLILSSRKNFDEKIKIFQDLNIKGEILYLSKDLFSFDEKEIKNFAEFFKLEFKENEIEKIKEITDGWPLYLNWLFKEIKESYKNKSFQEIIGELKANQKEIMEYVEKEVFSKLSLKEKKFLFIYGILEEKEHNFLKKVLKFKNPEKLLKKISFKTPYFVEKRNEFYVMHPLFKEFLEKKLDERDYKNIYNKLAKYYEKENIKKAILFYLKAQNFEKLIKIFLKNIKNLLKNREYHFMNYILENIPIKYFKKYPLLFYYKANIKIVWEKKISEGEELLEILKELKLKNKETKIKSLKSLIYEHKNETEKAIKIYKEIIKISKDKDLIKNCLVNLGISEGKKGNLEKAKNYFLKALKITGSKEKNIFDEININTNLFVIELEYGNYEVYEKMLELWEKYHLLYPYAIMTLTINLISLEIILNKIDEAEKHLGWFFEKSLDTSNDFYIGISYKLFGDIALLKKNFKEAENYFERAWKIAEEKDIKELKYRVILSFIENYIKKKDIDNLRKWIYLMEREFKEDFKIDFYKGKLKFLEGKYEDAKNYFEIYINKKINDKFFEILNFYNLILTEYKIKNYEKAKKIFDNIKNSIKEKYNFLLKSADEEEIKILQDLGLEEEKEIKVEEKVYHLNVNFLGNFEIFYNSQKLNIYYRTEKTLSLFAFLTYKSQFYAPDILIEMYYREMNLDKAKNNIYVSISSINKQFEKILNDKIIIKTKEGYGINPEISIKKDIDEFEENIKTAKNYKFKNEIKKSIEFFEKAKKIYKGDFLQNLYDFWVEEKREYYKNLYLNILENLGKIYKEIGELFESSLNFEEYLKINPFNKEIYNELIKIYEKLNDFQKIKKIQEFIQNL